MDLAGSCSGLLSPRCQLGSGLALGTARHGAPNACEAAWQHWERALLRAAVWPEPGPAPSVAEGATRRRQSPRLHQKSSEEKRKVFFKLMAESGLIRVNVPQQLVNYFMPVS